MINVNNAPSIFGETPNRRSTYVGLDALKDQHVSFNGYGIGEDDIITFPTREQFDVAPKKFIKTIPTYEKSKNLSVLFLVDRNGRESWLNLSVLTRQGYVADGTDDNGDVKYKREDIDEFRKDMRAMNDDKERVEWLFGKQIMGSTPRTMFAPEFGRDPQNVETYRKPLGTYSEYDYVTLEVADTPAVTPTATVEPEPEAKTKTKEK